MLGSATRKTGVRPRSLKVSRGQQTFKQRDLTKAIKAVNRAGVRGRVEIGRDGRIVVMVNPPQDERESPRADEWD